MDAVKQAKEILEAGETIDKAAREGRFDKDSVYDLHLMSAKPFIYVFNVDDSELQNQDLQDQARRLRGLAASRPSSSTRNSKPT